MRLFTIKDLVCSYNGHKPVFNIEDLELNSKEFTIIIGPSGSGKSTFLETLGLMNNTISTSEKLSLCKPNREEIDYMTIWTKEQSKLRTEVRKEFFSFVFQQNNLMNNFTALENICLAPMIEGKSRKEALGSANEFLRKFGLDSMQEGKLCQKLSGGEKQRIAFIRALSAMSPIIFGDEPTGNLDPNNADMLFSMLSDYVRLYGKTAIVVSHDIGLAYKYADRIVAIVRNGDSFTVHSNTVYIREGEIFVTLKGNEMDINSLHQIIY
jgi:lipoprotein-releasing system ATP-binding protein